MVTISLVDLGLACQQIRQMTWRMGGCKDSVLQWLPDCYCRLPAAALILHYIQAARKKSIGINRLTSSAMCIQLPDLQQASQ